MRAALDLAARVRIKPDVAFRDLDGEVVLLDLARGVYFGLDRVGTRIWHLVAQERSLGEIVNTLLAEYDVAETQCGDDVRTLVTRLLEQGLVERPAEGIGPGRQDP